MNDYDTIRNPILNRQIIETLKFACVRVIDTRETNCTINLVEITKRDLVQDLLEKIKDFILIDEIEEGFSGQTRYLAHIYMPYVNDEKIKKLNNRIYDLNNQCLVCENISKARKVRIQYLELPWYKKLLIKIRKNK